MYVIIDNKNKIIGLAESKCNSNNFTCKEVTQDEYNSIKIIIEKRQKAQNEINSIMTWFDIDYMRLEQKFRRLHTLGKLTDSGKNAYDELIQLYQIAEQKRQRIQELEALIVN